MAHYALLDENNIVTQVITGNDENGETNWEEYYATFTGQTCKRTSFNTLTNEHLLGGTAFRGNYASIGYIYDTVNDVFYPPQPYASWIISEQTNWEWKAPIDYPGNDKTFYKWNENAYQADNSQGWELVE